MNKGLKAFLLTCAIFLTTGVIVILFLAAWLFTAAPIEQKNITWGINFSQSYAESLQLDWKSVYLAALEDLGVKNIKLLTNWDKVEPDKDSYFFDDVDWQVAQAESHNAKVIYVLGMKTGRWPECHIPGWADGMTLSKLEQQAEILHYLREVILRYKNQSSIIAWQVENEPLVNFGECPWMDKEFLAKETSFIKSLDPTRPVIISDSGETSWWLDAGAIADTVSITLYRKVWIGDAPASGFYKTYNLKPGFYWGKSQIIKWLFAKKVIGGEIQAEPWLTKGYSQTSLAEQEKTMNVEQFKENIQYAKDTGLDTFYLWGTEWWYWMKETQHKDGMWNKAKELFRYGNIIE